MMALPCIIEFLLLWRYQLLTNKTRTTLSVIK